MESQPAGGYEVVGVDMVGPQRIGPCVTLDWEGRFAATGQGFRRVKASELETWELILPTEKES